MSANLELADVFRQHGDAYRRAHDGHLGRVERRVMSAIELCRTAALGGHVERCADCGVVRQAYNSCLMGKICNGELLPAGSSFPLVLRDFTPHYEGPLSRTINLSGGAIQ